MGVQGQVLEAKTAALATVVDILSCSRTLGSVSENVDVTVVRHESGVWHRPGTGDEHIIAEALSGAWSELAPGDGDVVLDLGGNIGTAARMFTAAGAAVHSFEPDVASHTLLLLNAPEAFTVNAAVTERDGTATLFGTPETPWANGLDPAPDSSESLVRTVAWEGVLAEVQPSIVKCDIEGGEYRLDWSLLPGSVRAVGIELHDVAVRAEDAARVHAELTALGFTAAACGTEATRAQDQVRVYIRPPAAS
jgi:FkbM family methyltransferase